MKPSVITYIGLVVAIFILVWGTTAIYQYYRGRVMARKPITTKDMHSWVPLHPTSQDLVGTPDPHDDDDDDQELNSDQKVSTKAQQNGHYSESKRIL